MTQTPQEAADSMMTLAEEQSRLSDLYAELEEKKIRHFNENRNKVVPHTGLPMYKSDMACERTWSGTEDGITYMKTEMRLKAIAKELSVLKTFLRHEENKARNLY